MPYVYEGNLRVWIEPNEPLELAFRILGYMKEEQEKGKWRIHYVLTHNINPKTLRCIKCDEGLVTIHSNKIACRSARTAEKANS